MAIHYRTQAIFLKKIDLGEADQLFVIFTKKYGKLEVLGRAIRKIKSKLKSGAEIFYLSEVEFIQGKTYKTLTDAIAIEKYLNIRRNLSRLNLVKKIAECVDRLVFGQEADLKIWNLLLETIFRQNSEKEKKDQILNYYYFFWSLLAFLGYRPELYNCALCQQKLSLEPLVFSPKDGGVICALCQKSIKLIKVDQKQNFETSPETVKILRFILSKPWPTIKKLKIDKEEFSALREITGSYYRYVLEQISFGKEN